MNPEEPPFYQNHSHLRRDAEEADAHSAFLGLLTQCVAGEESEIDIGRAALVIAAAHYPALNVEAYSQLLDDMAAQARQRIGREHRPDRIIAALNHYLFEECGLRGNEDDYYNPANSFLNEVLDTRSGLPIALSIVYMAIAQRLGLPVVGVGLPLHFIVKYVDAGGNSDHDILIDPFYGGEILTPQSCQERVERILGRPVVFDPAYLHPTPNCLILYRLLNNLKQVYVRRDEPERAGRVVEQMLVVNPDSGEDMRDRGLLLLQERAYSRAVTWLCRYLECVPGAADAADIRRVIDHACRERASRN